MDVGLGRLAPRCSRLPQSRARLAAASPARGLRKQFFDARLGAARMVSRAVLGYPLHCDEITCAIAAASHTIASAERYVFLIRGVPCRRYRASAAAPR